MGAPPWDLRVEADGYWSEPHVVQGLPLDAPIRVTLWPDAQVLGKVRVPEGQEMPSAVTLRLRKERSGTRAPGIDATVLCPLDGRGRLECRLPAVTSLDLRLRVPGFASRFFWSLDLTRRPVLDLGTVTLRPGASVVGRVEVPPGYDLEMVSARLTPTRGAPTQEEADERVAKQVAAEAGLNQHGLFSLEGLAAGSYRLVVRHPKLATQEFDPVQVASGSQTTIRDAIVLGEPVPLRLIFDPPFDPHGGEWRVEFLRPMPSGQRVRVLADRELVATAGSVEAAAPLGDYVVWVFDSRGVRMSTEEVTADSSGAPVVLVLEPILVDGKVLLGEEPLLARVTFRGSLTRVMDSDLEGRFSGYLPRAGEWDVAVEAIEPSVEWRTRALEIKVDERKDKAQLRLALSDTTLRGTVVDSQGTPIAGAEVTIGDPQYVRREVSVTSDADGEFEVRALEEGEIRAQAVLEEEGGRVWSSRPEVARLVEEETVEVRLVLRPHRSLTGRVVAPDGNPIPRAWIEISPYDGSGLLDAPAAQPLATDAVGRFDISLPTSIETIHLTVMAPGHPLTQVAGPLGDLGDLALDAGAGDLVLHLPSRVDEVPWADPAQARPVLVGPNGIAFPIGPLSRWSALNGHPWESDARELTLTRLADGRYAVCWFHNADLVLRTSTGRDCVATEVGAGDTVSLSLSQPASSP